MACSKCGGLHHPQRHGHGGNQGGRPPKPNASLTVALKRAARRGHTPGLYRRGLGWRVHLDVGGNAWRDVATLQEAARWLDRAIWASASRPGLKEGKA